MTRYYTEKLSARRLQRCYQIAPPRVQQYLAAELEFVLRQINPRDIVLELGCGYGRILPVLAATAGLVVGIDTSLSSLRWGKPSLRGLSNCLLIAMNALDLAFSVRTFDLVLCIQNGISAFQVDQKSLIRESIRVTKPLGTVLFSTYSVKFWEHRLEWFKRQSAQGLLGEIDLEKTRNGEIVCKDGFTATTVTPERFREIMSGFEVNYQLIEIDESSLFCKIHPMKR